VSLILFLIYIRDIFEGLDGLKIRSPSYMDDIGLTISSKSIKDNCILLKKAAEILFERGRENVIQFDMGKTELIHFHLKRTLDLNLAENSIKLCFGEEEKVIKLKAVVKWLDIWLDSKLSFKEHVERKIASAIRTFHQLSRLSNTE
jgi:hypothetical protein